jgi:hypothetical protein
MSGYGRGLYACQPLIIGVLLGDLVSRRLKPRQFDCGDSMKRDPAGRHRRQSGNGRGSCLDAVARHAPYPDYVSGYNSVSGATTRAPISVPGICRYESWTGRSIITSNRVRYHY